MALTLSPHPRLLLDSQTLTRMRQEYTNNTSLWQSLKAFNDSLMGGVTYLPNGLEYPVGNNSPDIGQGYQGESYIEALMNLAIGYWVLKDVDPTTANNYAVRAVDVLVTAATPYPGSGQPPLTDDGYGIRNYGLTFGYGYDWLFDFLTTDQKNQVITACNAWIDAFETGTFEFEHTVTNYYAAYFNAKVAMTLATYDENSKAATYWDDWYNNQLLTRVQPYYAVNLVGGGWPEGFANYSYPSIMEFSLATVGVKTATGIDITTGSQPFTYPLENGDFYMHMTWPSLTYMEDRDTNHANGNASRPPGVALPNGYATAGLPLDRWNTSNSAVFQSFSEAVSSQLAAYGYSAATASEWYGMLTRPITAGSADYTQLPRSYFAPGMNWAMARSSWKTGARYMSLRAGPFIENPNQGEQLFDQGGLSLAKGSRPFLANTFGRMVHEPNGSADENLLYNDMFSTPTPADLYDGNRQIFNIFYVADFATDGVTPLYRFGQSNNNRAGGSRTATVMEDGQTYVYTKSTNIEDQYFQFNGKNAIASWTRHVLFVRPNRFLVFDQTTAGDASYDQWLAWHFPSEPVVNGTKQSITFDTVYQGTMTPILPESVTTKTTALYPASTTPKVWQVQVRQATKTLSTNWLTLFDMADTAVSDTTVLTSASSAVLVSSSDGATAVMFSASTAGDTYQQPSVDADHYVAGLSPNTNYSATISGGNITVQQGSGYTSSANGVISFRVQGNSTVATPAYVENDPVDINTNPGGNSGGGTDTGGNGEMAGIIPPWSVANGNTYPTQAQALAEACALAVESPNSPVLVTQPYLDVTFVTGTGFTITTNNVPNPVVAIPVPIDPSMLGKEVVINDNPYWLVDGLGGFEEETDAYSEAFQQALSVPGVPVRIHPPNTTVIFQSAPSK
ncbi:MAG TPA: hypothetical protein VN081_04700 [Dongiaceae bacterium]|nr:hypothetical protein [Dongiaceae bacterium]